MPIFERVSPVIPVTIKTSSYTLVADDNSTEIQFQSASSVVANLPSVSAVENGFNIVVRNIGSGTLTIEPNDSDMIEGASSLHVPVGTSAWIRNDGTAWKTLTTNPSSIIPGPAILNTFLMRLENDSGTLKHRIGNIYASGNPPLASAINGPSNTATVTPTGTDSSTAFAAGGKISSTHTNVFVFDTADLSTDGDWSVGITQIADNSTGTLVNVFQ